MRLLEQFSDRTVIDRLAAEIDRLEDRGEPSAPTRRLATGWAGPDAATGGGLRLGAVHEWFSGEEEGGQGWAPPLGLMGHIASRAIHAVSDHRWAVWIGARVQPHGMAFGAVPELLGRSLFVLSDRFAERVWAIDLALRSPGVGVVIADGSGLGMRDSRRLQLAASSGGALCLLGRPWREHGEISAAWTRWRVRPEATPTTSPHWSVQLLRCKGSQTSEKEARQWIVRRDHETNDVGVVPELCGGACAPARPARRAFG